MAKKEPRIIKFIEETDKEGRTVFRPLTKADKRDMQSGLKNKKGLIVGETLEDSEQCPLEANSELPFGISLCGIESQTEETQRNSLHRAREKWLEGDKEEALKLLEDVLKDRTKSPF